LTTYAQSDTVPGNSCQPYFDSKKISIHYSYSTSNQTHDYSNNWDFDADGKTDELYFIGTGGAHLYFYLRIVLSSDKKVRNFPFLNLDFPCLGDIAELKNAKFYPTPAFPQFVVDNFPTGGLRDNANDKIYLHLDNYSTIPTKWKKRGVNSRYLLLQYDKGEMTIKNFIE
jgi:hypothetical protein